jgi:hypothetical protein
MVAVERVLPLSIRMLVTFRSGAFNTSVPEKHFVTVRSYGGDFANWLINELTQRAPTSQPTIAQQSGGWVVGFRYRRANYRFLVRFANPDWVGLLERRQGVVGRLLRMARKNVRFEALELMDSILSSSELFSDVRWHYDDPADTAGDPNSDAPDAPELSQ